MLPLVLTLFGEVHRASDHGGSDLDHQKGRRKVTPEDTQCQACVAGCDVASALTPGDSGDHLGAGDPGDGQPVVGSVMAFIHPEPTSGT